MVGIGVALQFGDLSKDNSMLLIEKTMLVQNEKNEKKLDYKKLVYTLYDDFNYAN